MALMRRAFACAVFAALPLLRMSAQVNDISGERMRAHVKFLASDLLEGRGVGTRGGDLAADYIATQFALAGLQPAGDHGSFFQKFTLVGAEPQESTQMTAQMTMQTNAPGGAGKTLAFKWLDDFVGVTFQQKA